MRWPFFYSNLYFIFNHTYKVAYKTQKSEQKNTIKCVCSSANGPISSSTTYPHPGFLKKKLDKLVDNRRGVVFFNMKTQNYIIESWKSKKIDDLFSME